MSTDPIQRLHTRLIRYTPGSAYDPPPGRPQGGAVYRCLWRGVVRTEDGTPLFDLVDVWTGATVAVNEPPHRLTPIA